MIRARACIKCKEYIVIHPNNPLNQVKINTFEKMHHQHTLITVDLDEIKDTYQCIKNNGNNGQEELNSHA
ncbi:MAG: hypothetical protein MUP85_17260 [Candidatus Lokiarchaeota archaeon]|nr:hypothetical protein [Candidatus Lokiarchaeota archaeon]